MQYNIDDCLRIHRQLQVMLRDCKDDLERHRSKHPDVNDPQSKKYEEIVRHYESKDLPMRTGIAQRRAVMDDTVPIASRKIAIEYIESEPNDLWQLHAA